MTTSVFIDPTARPELLLDGRIDLMGVNDHEGAEFLLLTQGDDATWGNPVPIDVWLTSMLQDGALVYTQGWGNREMFLRVKIKADDALGLQAGEDALFQISGRRTTLEWTPPDGWASTTVFDIHTMAVDHEFVDDEERIRTRTYGLKFAAAPFARSTEKFTLLAEPDGVAYDETVVTEATSTTGWTASDTLSVVSAQAVRATKSFPVAADPWTIWLEYAASITVTAGEEYVRVKFGKTYEGDLQLIVDGGTPIDPVAVSAGYAWFPVPAGTYSTMRVSAYHAPQPGSGSGGRPVATASLTVWSIYTTTSANFGTRRELARTFTNIPGSARAPGDLIVSHPSNGLGDVLVYVYPADGLGDYSPPLAAWRTTGGAQTADAATVSGTREPLNGTPATWSIADTALPPGAYHFLVRLKHTTAPGTYTLTYTCVTGGVTVTRTVKVTLDAADTWQIVSLGTEHLPVLRIIDGAEFTDGISGNTQITLASTEANLRLDTGWLFLADELDTPTALLQIAAGAEKTVTYSIADINVPTPITYAGNFAAGTKAKSSEQPQIRPPSVNIHTVTTDTADASAKFEGHAHWHTHAGS